MKRLNNIAAFFEGSPLIHETPMQLDLNCRAPWSDKMPTKVDDYICMKSLDPKRVDTPRICYVSKQVCSSAYTSMRLSQQMQNLSLISGLQCQTTESR